MSQMTAIEALRAILSKIQDSDSSETLTDVVGDIEEVAQGVLDDAPVDLGATSLELHGFQNSRRGIDAVLKALVLRAGVGQVRLTSSEIERARAGYDLVVSNVVDGDGLLLTARVR